MSTVSILEFRKNIYKYINNLPVTVTRKGKIAFIVIEDPEPGRPLEEVSTHKDVSTDGTMPENIESKNIGWCELHFEKGVSYPRKLITWEDESGNPLVENKWACPKCVDKYENMGRGKIYYGKT